MLVDGALLVGQLTGSHGIKGHIKLRSFTSDPFSIFDYSPLFFEDGQTFSCKHVRAISLDTFVVSVEGIDSRTKSDLLKGKSLYIQKDQLKKLDHDEFYFIDLDGCSVFDGDQCIGRVLAVNDFGAGIFLDIDLQDIKKTATLPFTKETVLDVDIALKRIIIDSTFLLY